MDDAHGFGVMGPNGRGTGEYYGCQDKIDIYLGTFAKAFAAIGGVAGSTSEVCDWVRFNARTQVFAKSLPMIYVEVLSRTLDFVADGNDRRARMWEVNAKSESRPPRPRLHGRGSAFAGHARCSSTFKDIQIAMAIIQKMREQGIFITGVMYPVVPRDIVLFRMIPTASHTDEDVARTVAAYKKVRDDLHLDLAAVKDAYVRWPTKKPRTRTTTRPNMIRAPFSSPAPRRASAGRSPRLLAARGIPVIGTSRDPDRSPTPVPGVRYLPLDQGDDPSIDACAAGGRPGRSPGQQRRPKPGRRGRGRLGRVGRGTFPDELSRPDPADQGVSSRRCANGDTGRSSTSGR